MCRAQETRDQRWVVGHGSRVIGKGRASPGVKGQRWGSRSYGRVGIGWKVFLNPGTEDGHLSPSSPYLSLSVWPAKALSSGWAILRMQEASEPWSGLWQGGREGSRLLQFRGKVLNFYNQYDRDPDQSKWTQGSLLCQV